MYSLWDSLYFSDLRYSLCLSFEHSLPHVFAFQDRLLNSLPQTTQFALITSLLRHARRHPGVNSVIVPPARQ